MRICASFLFIIALTVNVFAQSPGGFNYQAIVRDANQNVVSNQTVGIQISIKQGSANGPTVYQETFAPFSNDYGLINLEIGTGSVVSGAFSVIDWANGPYFMETAMDLSGGANYIVMGASQLRSVPYALHAGVAESLAEKFYSVNNRAHGGIVFYVNEEGTHGLVAAFDDQLTNTDWYGANDNLNNPAYHDKAGSTYMDWRLPTKFELNLMYQRKSIINNFTRDFYWSSIEANNGNSAWGQSFDDGEQKIKEKSSEGSVRLVRTF